jgi:methylase of polypeptide subunit release factors
MSDLLNCLKKGSIPQAIIDEWALFSIEAHNDHVSSLNTETDYEVFGNRFHVKPGLYHPHPCSSSIFILRTLLREKPRLGRLLEVGCGTGVIGLSLLHHGLADQLVLTDIDESAVETARQNAQRLGLGHKTRVMQGDLFEPIGRAQFDSLVFNLPLMHKTHAGQTHPAVDDPEGRLAQAFFSTASRHLVPGGLCFFPFSNISNPQRLEACTKEGPVMLLAAEWVARTGFWLMVYCWKPETVPA